MKTKGDWGKYKWQYQHTTEGCCWWLSQGTFRATTCGEFFCIAEKLVYELLKFNGIKFEFWATLAVLLILELLSM